MNAFGAESHMIEFFAGLGRNSTLKTLILAGTLFYSFLMFITIRLKWSSLLYCYSLLFILGNNINDEFGPAIGKALQENKSLTYLDLSSTLLSLPLFLFSLPLFSPCLFSSRTFLVSFSPRLFPSSLLFASSLPLSSNKILIFVKTITSRIKSER